MKAVLAWLRNKDNWNAVIHNVIANLIVAAIPFALAAGIMLWSYLQGQTGPWIVTIGLFSIAAALWARRELAFFQISANLADTASPAVVNDNDATELRARIDSLEADLRTAKNKAMTAERSAEAATKRKADMEELKAKKRTRLADMKTAIREQIDAAPKLYELNDTKAWMEATNDLLSHLHLPRMHFDIFPNWTEEQNKKRFQQALAHLRGLLVTLTEDSIHHY